MKLRAYSFVVCLVLTALGFCGCAREAAPSAEGSKETRDALKPVPKSNAHLPERANVWLT